MRVSLLLGLALVLPFAGVAWGVSGVVDRAGIYVGASLASLGEAIQEPVPEPEIFAWDDFGLTPVDVVSGDAPLATSISQTIGKGRKGKSVAARAPAQRGIRISADTVLRLASSAARPRGIPVKAEGQRPSGILLVGVAQLGVGLADGDVLVEAAGRPALAVAEVVSAVIAARAARAKEIGGRFWRNGEYWTLVVEQPYLPAPGSEQPQILQPGGGKKPANRGSRRGS